MRLQYVVTVQQHHYWLAVLTCTQQNICSVNTWTALISSCCLDLIYSHDCATYWTCICTV